MIALDTFAELLEDNDNKVSLGSLRRRGAGAPAEHFRPSFDQRAVVLGEAEFVLAGGAPHAVEVLQVEVAVVRLAALHAAEPREAAPRLGGAGVSPVWPASLIVSLIVRFLSESGGRRKGRPCPGGRPCHAPHSRQAQPPESRSPWAGPPRPWQTGPRWPHWPWGPPERYYGRAGYRDDLRWWL